MDDDDVIVFEPDMDLELDIGLDWDVVFTPEPAE